MPGTGPTPSPALDDLRAGFRALSDQDHLDYVRDAERARRRADAVHAVRIAELAARGEAASSGIAGAGTEEIGWLLGLSSRAAAHLVGTCEDLVSRPLVWDGLYQGLIDRTRGYLAWSPDARWTRLVTDPLTGVLLDAGTTTYRIPAQLRTAVRARDLVCRWPGCTRKAESTDTDHVMPHRLSGHTHTAGLVCLCRHHHHRLKTFGTWKITTNHTYALDLQITAPLGTTRATHPHHYPHRN